MVLNTIRSKELNAKVYDDDDANDDDEDVVVLLSTTRISEPSPL